MSMKTKTFISYNVNGIRAASKKGLVEWLGENKFDIVCFQEIKAEQEQVDVAAFEALGYKHHFWHSAEKKGYSGVATFCKIKPDNVVYGCGIEKYDKEGRVLQLDFGDVSLLNIYFPSGSSGEIRQAIKMEFLADILKYLKKLKKKRPNIVVCGDFNICHKEIDIHNPKTNKKSSGFLPEEREWMDTYFGSGFVDVFRHFNEDPHHYSWWSYRANARANNKGWRIDYHTVTEPLKERLKAATIYPDAKHSDHCPIMMKLQVDL